MLSECAQCHWRGECEYHAFGEDFCKTSCVDAYRAAPSSAWGDAPLPEDAAIKATHPTRTGRHDLYAEAMRLVGARHSKGALVELVNWLLVRVEEAERGK